MNLYKESFIDLRPGDVLLYRYEWMLTRPVTNLSACVRFFMDFPYNHVKLVSVDGEGGLALNEAIGKGLVSRPAEAHLQEPKSFVAVLRPKPDGLSFDSQRANSKVGVRYDYRSLILHQSVYQVTLHLHRAGWGVRPWWIGGSADSEERRMNCSEYAAWVYDLPDWWAATARSLWESGCFDLVWQEKELI